MIYSLALLLLSEGFETSDTELFAMLECAPTAYVLNDLASNRASKSLYLQNLTQAQLSNATTDYLNRCMNVLSSKPTSTLRRLVDRADKRYWVILNEGLSGKHPGYGGNYGVNADEETRRVEILLQYCFETPERQRPIWMQISQSEMILSDKTYRSGSEGTPKQSWERISNSPRRDRTLKISLAKDSAR